MNSALVFGKIMVAFGVESYAELADMVDWDPAHLSRMRSGKQAISPAFFLRLCIVRNCSPQQMADECGIDLDCFGKNS